MSYEVPQELEYKEKIIFNLTFEQLIYLVITSFLTFIIFAKTYLSLEIKIIMTSFLVVLSILFMFFNLKEKIQDFYSWYKFRNLRVAGFKMKSFLPVNTIENNTIILGGKNGNFSNKNKTN